MQADALSRLNVRHGAGDETRLKGIIEIFTDWAEAIGA